MDGGALLLIALTAVAAAVLVTVGWWGLARLSPGGGGSHRVPCCYRSSADQPWFRGTLRYDTDRLDHFGPGGLSLRPDHRWQRARLDLGVARPLEEGCAGLPSGMRSTAVTCRHGQESFELALGHQHYTALRSWLESVPPGWNSNVA